MPCRNPLDHDAHEYLADADAITLSPCPGKKAPMSDRFEIGDRVAYDDDEGEVVRSSQPRPNGGDMWVVRWDNGKETTVWGSDLNLVHAPPGGYM